VRSRGGAGRGGSAGFFPAHCVTPPPDTPLVLEVIGAQGLPIGGDVRELSDPTVVRRPLRRPFWRPF
jgi:hypothetical protein